LAEHEIWILEAIPTAFQGLPEEGREGLAA
jgi:hypothetical protein